MPTVAPITGVWLSSSLMPKPSDVAAVSLGDHSDTSIPLSGLEIAILGAFSQSPKTLHAASYTLPQLKAEFGPYLALAAHSDQLQTNQKAPPIETVVENLKRKDLLQEDYNRLFATEKLLRLFKLIQ